MRFTAKNKIDIRYRKEDLLLFVCVPCNIPNNTQYRYAVCAHVPVQTLRYMQEKCVLTYRKMCVNIQLSGQIQFVDFTVFTASLLSNSVTLKMSKCQTPC